MPSFSKAIAFLTAFAATSSITTTTVQGRLLAGHDSADSSDIVTCGQCLPIMEGDDAVIGVRLYKTSEPADEYMANIDEIFTPFYSTQPGFISYTGVVTQDPEVVMFVSIYDTEVNSAAAYDKGKDIHVKELHGDPDDELLMNYYGTITWTGDDPGGDEDCVKSFDVGDYLSARMHYGDDRQHGLTLVGDSYKAWSAMKSFDSYTSSKGLGEYDTDSFFFDTFNNKKGSAAANARALEGTALDPSISLIYNVVGQVVFDSTCSNDYTVEDDDVATEEPTSEESSEESSECETVSDIIRSNPNLSHFEGLYEAATNAEGYYVNADTWTVFAPTDKAIKSSGLAIDDVLASSAIRLLLFHEVKDQALTISDLNCGAGDNLIEMGSGQATRTICSNDIPIGQKGGGNDSPAHFVGDEIVACNGVIHIIDKVLLPPSTVSWYSGLGLE